MPRLFLPQPLLEEWALDERADFKDGKLVVAAEKASYPATPAMLFIQVVSGEDEKKLLSKVKTEDQLRELGGEQMADSVLLGENAYQVVPGYVAEVAAPLPTSGPDKGKPAQDADLLASYLLDKIGS
ncbi:MAG: hypothetical protein ACT4TC_03095 [Myxococcaceae bacterium]